MANLNANRRDHYLPQGYLRGFIDPARIGYQRPLWHFDIPTGVWSERSTREVGYRYGFYDYATPDAGAEPADSAFADLERNYPVVRDQLISANFEHWQTHREFLLRCAQMMRARSLLFFEQLHAEGKSLRAFVIEEISPDRRSVRVRSTTPTPLSNESVRNRAVASMRSEIEKGAGWLNDFNWALRYCNSPAVPFVISELPVMAYGPCSDLIEAMQHPETLIFFPLCWQACLVGSRQFFENETGCFLEQDMLRVRKMYRESASLYILSPSKIDL